MKWKLIGRHFFFADLTKGQPFSNLKENPA
jgi:hypothetical protein